MPPAITRAKTNVNPAKTYLQLRSRVRKAIREGRRRAEAAVSREKVRTSWEIGRHIHEHILQKKDRADYGARVIERLAKDLRISETELKYMREFAKEYPIRPAPGELTWTFYRDLLSVNDSAKRDALAKRAVSGKWSQKKLRSELRKVKGVNSRGRGNDGKVRLIPRRGEPGVFRTRKIKGRTLIDLGFATYVEKKKAGRRIRFVKDELFTYLVEVERVVDGDTLWCLVDLGFGVKARQKLRLRGIDAPEIISKSGRRAKRFFQRKLKNGRRVLITTSKSDKFDRYLVDLYCGGDFINQQLLDAGLALKA